jgi:tetratricopeptide (TPR) repeat protein
LSSTVLQSSYWEIKLILGRTLLGAAAATLLALTACASADKKAAEAAMQYEVAMAGGDAVGARDAMLRAVQAKDDVAEYWVSLARVQILLRQYADAYYAYVRAVELDRTNIEALQSLSEIALASGRVNEAERYSDEVQLLDPASLGAVTTKGFIALRRRNFDEAIRRADTILAKVPLDPNAKILKARALQGKGSYIEGVKLLEAHLATRADDEAVLQALLTIYRQQEDVGGVVRTGERLMRLRPNDRRLQFEHAQDLYKAGMAGEARPIAVALVKSPEGFGHLPDILSLWLSFEKRPISLADARSLSVNASPPARVAYARFFLEAGRPSEAENLLAPHARLPVTSATADAVAVLGHSKALGSQPAEGLRLLEAVLDFDSTNNLALRGRAEHHMAAKRYDRALADASRLVAENPSSAEDRLRLAECYVRLGNLKLAEKTYWAAFREIPGNSQLHASLRSFLRRSGQAGAIAAVDTQFEDQKRNLRSKLISA